VPAAIAIVLAGAAVGLSRIAIGAHWPSDALAGAALGLLAGVCGALAQRRWPLPPRPWVGPLLALVVLACAATLARSDTGYPLAQPLQLALAGLGAAAAVAALWRAWSARTAAPRPPG
jgi:undecaprenyl-diphosphatase